MLFCKETQCQKLICSACMTKHHLGHKVVDVSGNWKEKLLDNLASAIDSLSDKKEQIEIIQKENKKCLSKLTEEKRRILSLVQEKFDTMIRQATNQMEEHKREMTSLQDNLVLLNNIKQYIRSKTLSTREVKNCQETVDSITEHNDHSPLELCHMGYTEKKDKERFVEELCGELARKNQNIKLPGKQRDSTENMSGTLVRQSQDIGNILVKPLLTARKLRDIPRTEVLSSLPNQRLLPRFQRKLH